MTEPIMVNCSYNGYIITLDGFLILIIIYLRSFMLRKLAPES